MSFPPEAEVRAALEAIHACDWLAPKLTELVARHEHAAAIARQEWAGPHHDTFEERFTAVQGDLNAGRVWVFQVRREAEVILAELKAQALQSTAALSAQRRPG
ncbi:MAG: hypothetical protein QOC92_41 [Acidimicrobiaceae bacterium]|jgi:hypothetical protein